MSSSVISLSQRLVHPTLLLQTGTSGAKDLKSEEGKTFPKAFERARSGVTITEGKNSEASLFPIMTFCEEESHMSHRAGPVGIRFEGPATRTSSPLRNRLSMVLPSHI